MTSSNKEMTALSASRISTLKSCSWKYWANYKLKLPEKTNTGALMGTVCHTLFECLGNPRHKKHYELILEKQDIESSPSCARLLKNGLVKVGITDDESYSLVKAMCLNGLNYDFKAERYTDEYGAADLDSSEEPFDFVKDDGEVRYRIKGFIDKLWLFKQKSCALIRDFKSSKKMYSDKEFQDNMQNLMYVLAVKHLYPTVIKQRVEFLFLRFDLKNLDGVLHGHHLDEEELRGFEIYLTEIQKLLDNFTEEDAVGNLARKQGFVTDGSFGGALMCGKARSPADKKKDGSPAYYCPFKFPFDYYVLQDIKTGRILASAFEEEVHKLFDLEQEGQQVLKKTYGGCPAFYR